MKISGLQKLTLLDYPGKVACTVFTPGCNFRCPFCHNASLVFDRVEQISEAEVLSFLDKRKGILDGVCITGGEPTLQKDLGDFIRKIKEKGFLVKLDTNGTFPDRLQALLDGGVLDYVAMDIKGAKETYPAAAGVENALVEKVARSVRLLESSSVPHEFRTTTVKGIHTANDFKNIAQWIAGAKDYYIQQYNASDDLIGEAFESFSKEELEAFADLVRPYVGQVTVRGV